MPRDVLRTLESPSVQEIEQQLGEMEAQREQIEAGEAVLKQLLVLKAKSSPAHQQGRSAAKPAALPPGRAGHQHESRPRQAPAQDSQAARRRRLIVALIASKPSGTASPRDAWHELLDRGDETKLDNVRTIMQRMAKKGELVRLDLGVYGLPSDDPTTPEPLRLEPNGFIPKSTGLEAPLTEARLGQRRSPGDWQ